MATLAFTELADATGLDLGHSRWLEIDQARIDAFARTTEDRQWIHVDPERAAAGPFGGTIAHGYLTLSLAGSLFGELLDVAGASTIVNYGLDRARFTAPVPAGGRIRVQARISSVGPVPSGYQLTARVTVEMYGSPKPVCIADAIVRCLS
jgi:acyl dehydratase